MAASIGSYSVAEYLAGYAGVAADGPPAPRRDPAALPAARPGGRQDLRFLGAQHKTAGIPGPERSQTWVNQPDKMHGSRTGTGYKPGQARFGNAVYVYKPDFASGDYREGIVEEDDQHLDLRVRHALHHRRDAGRTTNRGASTIRAAAMVSCCTARRLRGGALDRSRQDLADCGNFVDGMDLTDLVKGRRQYLLRLRPGPTP